MAGRGKEESLSIDDDDDDDGDEVDQYDWLEPIAEERELSGGSSLPIEGRSPWAEPPH
jgi:hypothetical protein